MREAGKWEHALPTLCRPRCLPAPQALHLEQSVLLAGLPATLHLPRLQMLSVDWVVLASSHTVLTRQERLEHVSAGAGRVGRGGAGPSAPRRSLHARVPPLPGCQPPALLHHAL